MNVQKRDLYMRRGGASGVSKVAKIILLIVLFSGTSEAPAQRKQVDQRAAPVTDRPMRPLCSRLDASPSLPTTIVHPDLSEPTPIMNWRIIGPFVTGPHAQTYTRAMEQSVLETDVLQSVGCSEKDFRAPPPTTMQTVDFARDHYAEDKATEEPHFFNQDVQVPTPAINSQLLLWGSYHVFKVLYAAADIDVAVARDAVILVPTNSPIVVWVNGIRTQSTLGSVGENWDNHMVIRARLRAGRNHVLVKLLCFPLRNTFALWVTDQRGAVSFINRHGGMFDVVSQVIYRTGEHVLLAPAVLSLLFNETHVMVTLRNSRGSIVKRGGLHASLDTSELPADIYTVEVNSAGEPMSELLFIGDATREAGQYASLCKQQPANVVPCKSLDRLGIVLRDPQTSFVVDKQKLAVSLLANLMWLKAATPLTGVETSAPWIRAIPFRSTVDNSVQAYYLHVPALKYKGERLPLVVVEPPATSQTPFYDNALTLHQGILMKYARYADRFRFALIAVHGRGYQLPAGIVEADTLDAIKDIESRIDVDAKQLYIAGDCAGGRSAFLMAEQHPGLFARISTIEASTGDAQSGTQSDSSEGSVLNHLAKISNVPTQIIHGTADYHSPPIQADTLMREAAVVNYYPIRIDVPGDSEFGPDDAYGLMFQFFDNGTRPHIYHRGRATTLDGRATVHNAPDS